MLAHSLKVSSFKAYDLISYILSLDLLVFSVKLIVLGLVFD